MPPEKKEEEHSSERRPVPWIKREAKKIAWLQERNAVVFPKAPLTRIARELLHMHDPEHRMTFKAWEILYYANDVYAMEVCKKISELANHAHRMMVFGRDFVLWQKLCAEASIPMPDLAPIVAREVAEIKAAAAAKKKEEEEAAAAAK
jgi:histone H3/H4